MPNSRPWRTIVVREGRGREPVDAAAPVRVKRKSADRAASVTREDELPWRTLVTGGSTGRFTREQIREAVWAVVAEREARTRARAERTRAARAPRTGT